MAIPKKGSRKIIVDDVAYRWNMRRKPASSHYYSDSWGPTIAVELAENDIPGTTLVVETTNRPWLYLWGDENSRPITPADVARAIKLALAEGWHPAEKGSPFKLRLPEESVNDPDIKTDN